MCLFFFDEDCDEIYSWSHHPPLFIFQSCAFYTFATVSRRAFRESVSWWGISILNILKTSNLFFKATAFFNVQSRRFTLCLASSIFLANSRCEISRSNLFSAYFDTSL